jgi:V/A-type H+-transporting ATPase subunit F
MNHKVAIIGPEDVVSGFRMLGVDMFHAENAEAFMETFLQLQQLTNDPESKERYAVVMAIESLAKGMGKDDEAKLMKYPLPALVFLPGIEGSSGQSADRLKMLTEKAIGTDIMEEV